MTRIDQIAAPGAHASSGSSSSSSDTESHRNRPYLPSHRPEALRLTRASSLTIAKSQQDTETDQGKRSVTVESSPEQMPADHDNLSGLHSPLLENNGRNSPRNQTNARQLSDTGDRDGTAINQSRGMRGAFASIAGLVIHAAADGIAMGASAGSGDDSLKFIVLFAIMIHKAVSDFIICA